MTIMTTITTTTAKAATNIKLLIEETGAGVSWRFYIRY